MTVSMLAMSVLSRCGIISSYKLWTAFRKNTGGLVIREMKISVNT